MNNSNGDYDYDGHDDDDYVDDDGDDHDDDADDGDDDDDDYGVDDNDHDDATHLDRQYRRTCLKHLQSNLHDELKFSLEFALDNPKNYQIFHHRRMVAGVRDDDDDDFSIYLFID